MKANSSKTSAPDCSAEESVYLTAAQAVTTAYQTYNAALDVAAVVLHLWEECQIPALVGVRAAELKGENVTCLLHEPELVERHKKIFSELVDSSRPVRSAAVTGWMKRQDGKPSIEVVVKLAKVMHLGSQCIKGYLFEIPS